MRTRAVAAPGGTAAMQPEHDGVRLLWEADLVLALIPQLRASGFVANLPRLREQIAGMLRDFQARARSDGIAGPRIEQATQVLAALINQVVTSMPWGADAGWRSLAISAARAQGAPPGATAALLDIARASSTDAGMRELIGVALALGLDGRKGGAHDAQIEQLRSQLASAGPKLAERAGQNLSPASSGMERAHALSSWLPLWVSSLAIAAALAVLYFALELSLGAKSDRLYATLAALNAPAARPASPLPAAQPRLAGLLSEQAAASNLAVRDEIDRSVIVVSGSALFQAGGATLQPQGGDLLRAIAAALEQSPGRIQIIGHTAGSGAHSARYPSDWDLSVDRARTVDEALHAFGIDATRLSHDGRASIEPERGDGSLRAVGGDGRIEIVLLAGR